MGELIVWPKPPAAMAFTGERLTSDYGGQTQIEHLHRYLLAREWCRGRDVLDVASGEGYGTALLAQTASSATGIELSDEAVAHASASYAAANLHFFAGDARKLPMPDAAFDVVVSFETIEHFAEHVMFLQEIRRVLRPGGLLIVSTPDRDNYSPAETPANPYHVKEMTGAEFQALLHAHFSHVSVLLQRPVFGSVTFPEGGSAAAPLCFERRGDTHFESSAGLSRPQYLLAFASDQPVAALPPSVYIETGRLGLLSPPEAEARFLAAETALSAAQAEQGRLAAELARVTEAFQEEQAQIEAYSTAARQRAAELEALRLQLAELHRLREQVASHAGAEQDRALEMESLRGELAGLRGEVKGLLVASQMAEGAVAAMRARSDDAARNSAEAARDLAAAEAANVQARDEAGSRVAALETSLAAVRAQAETASAFAWRLQLSTSWRLTAPVRGVVRTLLRRP